MKIYGLQVGNLNSKVVNNAPSIKGRAFCGLNFPIVFILIICLASACTTVQTADYSPEALRSTLEVGDLVEITTKDGKEYDFTIAEVSENNIEGEGNTVAFQDIEDIEIQRINTAGQIAAVAVVGAYVYYFLILPIIAVVSLASWAG